MKTQSILALVLRGALGAICLVGTASAHPGHPGHDSESFIGGFSDNGKLLLAVIVTTLALFMTRSVYRRLP